MAGGSEFPKWLYHPGFSPAVLSEGAAGGPLTKRGDHYAPVGKPAQFPPVIVRSRDDEAWHLARGYSPAPYDHAAVLRQQIAPMPIGYREQEYPRFEEDGSITPDPNPPAVDTKEFPKWVAGPDGDEVAETPEKEAEILARKPGETLVVLVEDDEETESLTRAEIAVFREWLAAGKPSVSHAAPSDPMPAHVTKAPERNPARGTAEQRELIEFCREAGIKADTRHSVRRLRAMLDAATAPSSLEKDDDGRGTGEHQAGSGAPA